MIQLEVLSPSYNRPSPSKGLLSVGASVPIATKGKVYVWGYNDMAIKQKMGIHWIVKDPDEEVVEDYSDWSFEYVNPDEDHRFYGDRFDINKVGTYTIAVSLLMNPDSPVVVDSYDGVLCVAEAVVEAEFRDFGITSYDTVVAGEKIELAYGDTLKVNVSFDYRGPAGSATLYSAIGNSGFPGEELIDEGSFLKRLTGEQSIELPQSLEFTPVAASVDIPITTEISPYTNYDLYVKLVEYRKEAGMPKVDNVIDILPEYELIQETIYPYAYIYDGDAELVTATFKTDPFTPADWIADKVASKLKEEARKEGGRVLEVRAWVDKTPLLWTNFRIDVISTPLRETAGGAPRQTAIPLWATVIIIALAIIAIIMVTYHFIIKPLTYKHKPISEKLKKAWSKPTLFGAINDWEIDLGLTPTPLAELEGMSYQEQLDYADMLAKEIAPPGIDWLPWVIGAGVGVLGLGTVAVLAKKKK